MNQNQLNQNLQTHQNELIQGLLSQILLKLPEQKLFLAQAYESLSLSELMDFAEYIQYGFSLGLSLQDLADAYIQIVRDMVREQMYFLKHKRYRHSSYAEVAHSVYHNPEYMQAYMHGLALTEYLWPNHIQMRRFFEARLPLHGKGHYLEIGPGHGQFLTTALKKQAFETYLGVDISESSIELTRRSIEYFAAGTADYQLQQIDFLASVLPATHFDAVVMGEVLEHVENPGDFLKEIARCASSDAFIYVTTCINSPAIDHIYLFKNAQEIDNLVMDSGLVVKEQLLLPYHGTTLEQSVQRQLPMNLSLILKRADTDEKEA